MVFFAYLVLFFHVKSQLMKAAVYRCYGPPEVVQIQDIPNPSPKSDEVLIKVFASTVNRTDCGFRSAEYFISRFWSGLFRPNEPVLGCEFAGEVVSVGEKVKKFQIGDRVYGFDDARFGGHAQFKTISENAGIAKVPNGIDYQTAAMLTEGSHYALGNIRAAKTQAGQQVMVYGATGAIGSAAVQLLKYFGAHVTAVCPSAKVDLVKSLGADVVIDYTKEDISNLATRFDLIFDAVGKSSWGACKQLLKPQGKYMSTELGKNGENVWKAILLSKSKGKRLLFPIPTTEQEDIRFLGELAAKGYFKPVLDRTYDLENIVEAYRYVETGQKTGNVVISIPKD